MEEMKSNVVFIMLYGCSRCESILQPGFNCTVRLKNKKRKGKRHKKSNSCQNKVGYACHFCGDQNLIMGTGKGIMNNLLSSRKPASMDTISKISKGDSRNDVAAKERLAHSQAAVSQIESSSRLKQSTLEKDERVNVPKQNVPEDFKTEERVVCSTRQLADGTVQQDITEKIVAESTNGKCMNEIEKIVAESTNGKCMNEIEPGPSERTRLRESDATLQAEFPVGSKFVTPQKNKLTNATNPKGSAELLKTGSTQNKKVESSGSVAGKAPTSSSKSSQDGSVKKNKSESSDSVAGGSRKRARKGWTTLKQIAEKEELERKEKMGNFVIPFFMQQ